MPQLRIQGRIQNGRLQREHLMNYFDPVAWSAAIIADHNRELMAQRLAQGRGKRVVFTPFLGEFGHKIMHHARLVHFAEAEYKGVCCQPGEEVLYPSANEFFYRWQPLPDGERQGTDRYLRQWPEIEAKYADHLLIQSGGLSMLEEKTPIEPTKRIPFNFQRSADPRLTVDVCIGTRKRELNARQNWSHCQLIADACKARGLTFATIAHPEVGYHLDGETCMSGEFESMDAAIQLLQSAKFYFSQDSGCAHLASTVGIDMAVLKVPHKIWAEELARANGTPVPVYGRDFIDRMIEVNFDRQTIKIEPEKWFEPNEVLSAITPFLDAIQPKAPIKKIATKQKRIK
jgi:hypothetical protein